MPACSVLCLHDELPLSGASKEAMKMELYSNLVELLGRTGPSGAFNDQTRQQGQCVSSSYGLCYLHFVSVQRHPCNVTADHVWDPVHLRTGKNNSVRSSTRSGLPTLSGFVGRLALASYQRYAKDGALFRPRAFKMQSMSVETWLN